MIINLHKKGRIWRQEQQLRPPHSFAHSSGLQVIVGSHSQHVDLSVALWGRPSDSFPEVPRLLHCCIALTKPWKSRRSYPKLPAAHLTILSLFFQLLAKQLKNQYKAFVQHLTPPHQLCTHVICAAVFTTA